MDQNNQYFDLDSVQRQEQGVTVIQKRKSDKGPFIIGLVVGIFSTLLITCIVVMVARYMAPVEIGSSGKSGNDSAKAETTVREGFVTNEVANKVDKLVNTIRRQFYLREVTDEELTEGIYKGLLEALDDPYSEYYTAEEFEEQMSSYEGVYYGIGAYISLDEATNLPKIASVIKGTPAEEVGLHNNDLIYMVDGTKTYGMKLDEAVGMIKGPENTEVKLTIIRSGEQMEIQVTRRRVETPTVESKMLENDMGYLQIASFDDVTYKQFMTALSELKESGMRGMILDLRANPGGNVDTVVEIARNILPEGLVVYMEDKSGKRVNYNCKGDNELDVPLVVLVDMNSASASEILAGAIQDHKKGTLVGTTTYGKGIVQSVIPNKDGSAIKITVSSYYTPSGRNIHKIGIEPDVICEFDGQSYYNSENPVDNQLEKAKEVLSEMMK